VVRYISDVVAVMYLGKIVESAPAKELFDSPLHPYTKALLSAVPVADPGQQAERERIILTGDVPSPVNPPPGCSFHPRCTRATDICSNEAPVLEMSADNAEGSHSVYCHHWKDIKDNSAADTGGIK